MLTADASDRQQDALLSAAALHSEYSLSITTPSSIASVLPFDCSCSPLKKSIIKFNLISLASHLKSMIH